MKRFKCRNGFLCKIFYIVKNSQKISDIASRWKDHAKCGLHIDTPAGNKLYQSMQEYGIQNFSWEVLEEVPPALLNEKEKYYIELYDSYNYGFNSNRGISK